MTRRVPVIGGPYDGAEVRPGRHCGWVGPYRGGHAVFGTPAPGRTAMQLYRGQYIPVAICADCGALGPPGQPCGLCQEAIG